MEKPRILVGSKQSPLQSSLLAFEHMSPNQWAGIKSECHIPTGFMFLAGVAKYHRRHPGTRFRCEKDHIFVQSFLPHSSSEIHCTREYGALYSLYEPKDLKSDDVVLDSSAIYQALPDNKIRLVLANGENRNAACVAEMFRDIIAQKDLLDFSPAGSVPRIFQVTFEKKSCGYFLKGRTYLVWALSIGLPDQQSGEISKGWLFCDINCGVPAIMKADREDFIRVPDQDGDKVGLFTVSGHKLIFSGE